MLSVEKQKLINELKKARQIKAETGFKVSLYEKLAEADADFFTKFGALLPLERNLISFGNWFKKSPVFAPLSLIAMIIILAGGGTGITLASQFALPGEILYSVKIVSEKTRVALTSNNDEKARLHFEFSSRRLVEVAELAKDTSSDPRLTEIAVENYKKELGYGQIALLAEKSEEEAKKAADLLSDITSKNKESIAKIGIEARNHKVADSLKNAWEDTIEHNDKAVLITLKRGFWEVATSSVVNLAMEKKVNNKISGAEKIVSEANKYLLKKKEKGIDVSEAEKKINSAREIVAEAKELLSQKKYESAFNKAKEAYKTAIAAKIIIENINSNDDDDDKLEMFRKYYLPDNATSSNGNLSTTTGAIFNQPASVIKQIDDLEKNNREKDDEENNNERLNQERGNHKNRLNF